MPVILNPVSASPRALRSRQMRKLSIINGISSGSRIVRRHQPQFRPDCSPPMTPFSHNVVAMPLRARKRAADTPTMPPPTITTSVRAGMASPERPGTLCAENCGGCRRIVADTVHRNPRRLADQKLGSLGGASLVRRPRLLLPSLEGRVVAPTRATTRRRVSSPHLPARSSMKPRTAAVTPDPQVVITGLCGSIPDSAKNPLGSCIVDEAESPGGIEKFLPWDIDGSRHVAARHTRITGRHRALKTAFAFAHRRSSAILFGLRRGPLANRRPFSRVAAARIAAQGAT